MLKKLQQLQQRYTRPSRPRTHGYTSLLPWALLGFALGFSPIIIFLGFIPAAKNHPPVAGYASPGMPAYPPPARTTIETPAPRPMPATTGEAQAQTNPSPAATPAVTASTVKKQAGEKRVKRAPKTWNAAVAPAKPPAASHAARGTAPPQRTAADTDSIPTAIVYQSWEQNSPESVFPRARVGDCSTGKGGVVCWTDVLTGQHHSREYRYKIKIIFDKFRADGQFVMTYRNLVLSSGGKPSNEEAGGLGALPENMRPGWQPMIHRLPCQLASQDKIICRPIGEARFEFKGTAVQTRLGK